MFDRYKASFYRLYNRELRNNPALKGQMVLRLTIEPDGSVSMCALQSTDMDAPDLATQVVEPRPDDQFRREGWCAGCDDRVPDRLPAGGLKTGDLSDRTATRRVYDAEAAESDQLISTRF